MPKTTVAIFSFEMSAEQLATRLLSEEARYLRPHPSWRIGQREFDRFVQVSREIARLPIEIDDTRRSRCRRCAPRRRLKRTKGLELVVVDYLQLCVRRAEPSRTTGCGNSQITQGLKAIAKELGVRVLALSQLSRAVENREDKRPQLADCARSGTIEQDADIGDVRLRDEYYLEQRAEAWPVRQEEKFQAALDEWHQQMERSTTRRT